MLSFLDSSFQFGGAPSLSCQLLEKLPGLPVMLNFGVAFSSSIFLLSSCWIAQLTSGRSGGWYPLLWPGKQPFLSHYCASSLRSKGLKLL
jgi:hypothetical protein